MFFAGGGVCFCVCFGRGGVVFRGCGGVVLGAGGGVGFVVRVWVELAVFAVFFLLDEALVEVEAGEFFFEEFLVEVVLVFVFFGGLDCEFVDPAGF